MTGVQGHVGMGGDRAVLVKRWLPYPFEPLPDNCQLFST